MGRILRYLALNLNAKVTFFQSDSKVISIDACPEKDPFASLRGMSTIFPTLRSLESLRLDGTPLGSLDFPWPGDTDLMVLTHTARNLRCVSVDFCDATVGAVGVLWGCVNLEFLGFAGLVASDVVGIAMPATLPVHRRLKTLRFETCSPSILIWTRSS
jgi:hypothetical protein